MSGQNHFNDIKKLRLLIIEIFPPYFHDFTYIGNYNINIKKKSRRSYNLACKILKFQLSQRNAHSKAALDDSLSTIDTTSLD